MANYPEAADKEGRREGCDPEACGPIYRSHQWVFWHWSQCPHRQPSAPEGGAK